MVAESISTLGRLESVNLSFNEIKASAGCHILESLSDLSTHLTSLNLDGNMFGPSTTEQLVTMAKEMKLPLASLRFVFSLIF